MIKSFVSYIVKVNFTLEINTDHSRGDFSFVSTLWSRLQQELKKTGFRSKIKRSRLRLCCLIFLCNFRLPIVSRE